MDWVPSILLTAAFLALVATSIRQIVTTCRQWRHLAKRYPVASRMPPERRTRVWRAYVGSLFHPFQHLRLAWDEQAIFLIPSPLTQRLGFGPLCLPRTEIDARPVRRWGSDWVEMRPKDASCAVLLISRRAWRKSGLPLP
jgi:hypothetical protein